MQPCGRPLFKTTYYTKGKAVALIDIDDLKRVLGIGDIYADAIVQEVADAASNVVSQYLIPLTAPATYDDVPEVRQSVLAVAVDIWITQYGTAAQQDPMGQPAPWRLGRTLVDRVRGMLGEHYNIAGQIG